jgi:hypothetical protein
MKTVYMCRSDEFCPDCTETGGEYGIPVEYRCMAIGRCDFPQVDCLFVQAGGKRNG